MKIPDKKHNFKSREIWRKWLSENHAKENEAWIIIFKKKYEDQGLSLNEAIEEALCYGWIDGTLKSIDEQKYALRFSPRTSKSIWSISNIRRVEKLIGMGKMTDAGMQKIIKAKENGEWEAAIRREQVDEIPDDLEKALKQINGALPKYQALPDSRKKQFIYWLQSAKRTETKEKRIQKIINELIES